ncbi:HNH endonuclease [Solibacillus sp. CAU 1738]|uniref:HNH endonuclease n=1 Tax=Solibacillus sp. CAU 1738 TaxID=3140363 RepID=UPI0032613F53
MNIFVELTNPVHGGEGWELGEVLWSPCASSWNIMKLPKEGDLVIHSVKGSKEGKNHRFWGISFVSSAYTIVHVAPPIPGKWGGYETYYRIPLIGYHEFEEKKRVEDFLSEYREFLIEITKQRSFYTEENNIFKTAQKYLALVSDELFNKLKEFLNIDLDSMDVESKTSIRVGDEEESTTRDEDGQTTRVSSVINRIVRDTKIVRELKKEYDGKCQICGEQIILPSEKKYSEGHHLKKLGGIHQGPDIKSNIIILCPNHHVEFDYGIIAIEPTTGKIIHINTDNLFHGKDLAYSRTDLNPNFIKYHYNEIFGK